MKLLTLLFCLMLTSPALAADINKLRVLATQGDAMAQFSLGGMYSNGIGVPKNYREAFLWYAQAAEQGLAMAQANLGVVYESGEGVAQNYREAVKWYMKAAEQGNATAQTNLAALYVVGNGVGQNNTKAYMWLHLAAFQGNQLAIKGKRFVANRLTPEAIAKGKELAAQCRANNYKGC